MPRHSAITKPRRRSSSSLPFDFLCTLPCDISTAIVDQLRDEDLRHLPHVSHHWAALFRQPHADSTFRYLVRTRFGLTSKPPHTAHKTWGELYLSLRRERCHLCPNVNVAPFVYAGSGCLSLLLLCRGSGHASSDSAGLALFPVCKPCFELLLSAPHDSFVPVVERRAVTYVFPRVPKPVFDRAPVDTGYLYSDIPGFQRGHPSRKGLEYSLAKPFVAAISHHRHA